MVHLTGSLMGLAAAPLALGAALSSRASQQVTTSYGAVQGATSDLESSVTSYKGIPFAAPPVGDLRWTAPTSPANWTGVLNATSFGADCAQSYSSLGIFSSGSYDISEDCLYMNIWTPSNATSTSSLPVFLWIYGGRFEGGAGSVPTYDGSHLAAKGMVVVTFNYRMGPFGFLAHPDLSAESPHNSSGNYGILDQIQAIDFLKEEVAAFGGNPDHITVGGQSAGSASSAIMMYSPLSNDKIVGSIIQSGVRDPHDPETYGLATSHRWMAPALAQGIEFVSEMNVTSIAELRNVSMEDLLAYDSAMDTILDGTIYENSTISLVSEPPLWRPVVDGYVLPYGYGESLSLNAHGQIPILTGDNLGESDSSSYTLEEYQEGYTLLMGNVSDAFFAAYPATDDSTATNQSAVFGQDINRVSTWGWASDWYAGGATEDVFVYFWTHAPPNQTSSAYHGSELWYTFGNLPTYYNYTWTAEDYEIQEVMGNYWANFIKNGNPNGDGLVNFPVASPNSSEIMWLGNEFGASYITDNSSKITVIKDFFANNVEW
ncbi:prolyl oligopeptidase-like protein [Xylariales sp. PMI_506]|nr:prolyl oligopeptidase-like protein [Xylariales sp. PMI_506]